MKGQRGITLIALVVTIIVLLILAGVTISMVLGQQGIFGKAEDAKNTTEISQLKEEIKLSWLTVQTEYQGRVGDAEETEVSTKMQGELVNYDNNATAKYDKANKKVTGEYKGKQYQINVETGEVTIEGGKGEETIPTQISSMVSCNTETERTSGYLGNTTITRDKIESVTIGRTKAGHREEDENCWDVSSNQDKSVLAWYEDKDTDGYYEVTIAGEGGIKANEDASYLFSYIGYAGDDTTCIYGLEKLDISEVTNMSHMFYYCGREVMTSLDLGGNFDTSNVTNMDYMFAYCGREAMTSLDLGNKFNTSNVTNMDAMFCYCGKKAMTSLELGENFNTSNVTTMYAMFESCGQETMTSLDLGNNFDTSNVTTMACMFYSCGEKAMTNLDLGDKFNTSNVTSMGSMFSYCGYTAMKSLDLGENFDTSKVTNMYLMFKSCGYTAMTSLNLGGKFDTSKVTNMEELFAYCGQEVMTKLSYGNTVENFKIKCANLITNAQGAYFRQSNFAKCTAVTCTNGSYTIPAA